MSPFFMGPNARKPRPSNGETCEFLLQQLVPFKSYKYPTKILHISYNYPTKILQQSSKYLTNILQNIFISPSSPEKPQQKNLNKSSQPVGKSQTSTKALGPNSMRHWWWLMVKISKWCLKDIFFVSRFPPLWNHHFGWEKNPIYSHVV